jgi:hypothetical protein
MAAALRFLYRLLRASASHICEGQQHTSWIQLMDAKV